MDKSCIDECPVDCIYEGERKLYINPGECIDCGACEPACPQSAIFLDWRAPAEAIPFLEDNKRFFTEALPGCAAPLGSPGGSADAGPIGTDTPWVQTWPGAP
jgi:NAD-dependent dihydropyrimidine dehydrogenase PreA subunit